MEPDRSLRRDFLTKQASILLGCSLLPIQTGLAVEQDDLNNGRDLFRRAQSKSLEKFHVAAKTQFVKLANPSLTVQVIHAGSGDPVIFLHGGPTVVQFAPMFGGLQSHFRLIGMDRPGCGLSQKIDNWGPVYRERVVACVTSLLDALKISQASFVGNSMGGYYSLVFALAKPERVRKLVLIGEIAGSSPSPHRPNPSGIGPSLEGTRADYAAMLVQNIDRVSPEILEADYAASQIPGAASSNKAMMDELAREGFKLTYSLRPELAKLKPETLFIWGRQDKFGDPRLGQEMATLAPHARCEIVEDAGHVAYLDQPELCIKLTAQFLEVS